MSKFNKFFTRSQYVCKILFIDESVLVACSYFYVLMLFAFLFIRVEIKGGSGEAVESYVACKPLNYSPGTQDLSCGGLQSWGAALAQRWNKTP